jgi:hypothetical protein
MVDETVPTFVFDEEKLQAIRDQLGIDPSEAPTVETAPINEPPPVKRRRGRPRKHPVSETGTTVPELAEEAGVPLAPGKLTKRNEKDVAERLVNMLMAGTGIASQAKPYLAMTEEEAKAISDPLASYLVRNADTVQVAEQILENYDLLAIILGVLAYTVRIYRDRVDEVTEQRKLRPVANANPTALDRISKLTDASSAGPENGYDGFVSTPYVP